MALRLPASLALLLFLRVPLAAQVVFRFAPGDGVRFVRTLTRTARVEIGGMMRTETTIFTGSFVFHRVNSGLALTMTPLSFRYLVNDRDRESPVWHLIEGHQLHLMFNVVGKLTEVRGYETVDQQLGKGVPEFSGPEPTLHFDRYPIGAAEREGWDRRTQLWMDQSAKPGTVIAFDSAERGFTGDRLKTHTEMRVLDAKPCGPARCVSTVYKMVPDLRDAMRHANEHQNNDFIDAAASKTIEQIIEPATMLLHYERLVWQADLRSLTTEGNLSRNSSLTIVSEFTYDTKPSTKRLHKKQ